jgi:hypothetical protein
MADRGHVSARWNRAAEAGEASAGARTTQTYILGIGASGALLAGAGVTLISLVGLVSFDVWPGTPSSAVPEEAQLNLGGGGAVTQPIEEAPLSEAAAAITSATAPAAEAAPSRGGGGGGGDRADKQPGVDGNALPEPPASPAPATPYVPPLEEPDGGASAPGNSKDEGKSDGRDDEAGDPLDDPDEADPGQPSEKILPGHSADASRGGRDAPDWWRQSSRPWNDE